jgi:PEP-CTERM motif
MKLSLVLLLCVGVLFATAPAWADRVPCCEFAKGSTIGLSPDFGHGFETSNDANFAKNAFPSSSVSQQVKYTADLSELALYERFSDHTKPERVWFDGRGKDRNPRSDDPGPTSVPEPDTLPLLLLGVTAVGIFARRRINLESAD